MRNWMKISIAAILAVILVLVFFVNSFKITDSSALLPRILLALIESSPIIGVNSIQLM